jgi:UDP-N-acetyl-D-glucosamine dehydrogenase
VGGKLQSSILTISDVNSAQGSEQSVGEPTTATLPNSAATLADRITNRTAVIGIIGLGYVGLPLARAFSKAGYQVTGFDTDPVKIVKLNEGDSYFKHIPGADIQEMRRRQFSATDEFQRLREADVVIICVPTPLTDAREPDLSFVIKSAESIAQSLRRGQLVVLESTTYPGTTRDVILPILSASALKAGQDFFLAYSPEREDPGNAQYNTSSIPKLVGGIEPASQRVAMLLYGSVVERVIAVSTPETAEASKILENTYRAVNIALINELKMLFERMNIDVWEVIEAAKTKPFGFQAFYPGPGLGGHCIPIDPFYLTWVARKHGITTRFIELAGEINTAMPRYVVARVADALNDHAKPLKGSRILILGAAYKKDIDDVRESPALELIELLLERGAHVSFHDPYIQSLPRTRRHPRLAGMVRSDCTPKSLQAQDCVVIITDHSTYDWSAVVANSAAIVDTRNATREFVSGARNVYRS